MRVADLILKTLGNHGVRHIFGMPGDAINDLTDAIRRQDAIRFIGVRHEEAGAFAAAAQAKLTGRLAACVGTAGPGAIHLLNGLYDAKMDHAPVIAITGQVATSYIGTSYHQEVELERLFSDVALYSQTIMTKDQLPAVVQEACRAAITGRGVAHLSVPTDLAGAKVSVDEEDLMTAAVPSLVRPNLSDCQAAVQLLNDAQHIAILAGVGCAGAQEELRALARKLDAPVIRTLRAKDVLDDDPLCIGGIGLLGGEPAIRAVEESDVLLIVGADFPYSDFYPDWGNIIQIDLVPTQIGKRHPVDVGLVGHAGPTMAELKKHVDDRSGGSFISGMHEEMKLWIAAQDKAETSAAQPIKPQRVMRDLAEAAPDNAVFVCDTGTVTAWSARHLRLRKDQRFTLSSSLGSMAYALPGALGAQLAYPERTVFALAGDGGFAMLMADFATAVREELPIIVIILNNSKLGFIALEQRAKGLPEHDVDLTNPDFATFAESCGGLGYRVQRAEEFSDTLRASMAQRRPTVIDVQIDPNELVLPPHIEIGDAVNFAFAKAKEFLS